MLFINNETFEKARNQISDISTRQEGLNVLRKILEIKQAHLWRSEVIAPCCGNLGGFACQLYEETSLLEKAIALIEGGDIKNATPLLDRLSILISYGIGQKETSDLIYRLTSYDQ